MCRLCSLDTGTGRGTKARLPESRGSVGHPVSESELPKRVSTLVTSVAPYITVALFNQRFGSKPASSSPPRPDPLRQRSAVCFGCACGVPWCVFVVVGVDHVVCALFLEGLSHTSIILPSFLLTATFSVSKHPLERLTARRQLEATSLRLHFSCRQTRQRDSDTRPSVV